MKLLSLLCMWAVSLALPGVNGQWYNGTEPLLANKYLRGVTLYGVAPSAFWKEGSFLECGTYESDCLYSSGQCIDWCGAFKCRYTIQHSGGGSKGRRPRQVHSYVLYILYILLRNCHPDNELLWCQQEVRWFLYAETDFRYCYCARNAIYGT